LAACILPAGAGDLQGITANEARMIHTAIGDSAVQARDHIILVWPRNLVTSWCEESTVKNPQQMADWLEDGYRFYMHWTRYDPNSSYQRESGSHDRLIFIYNGKSDFNFPSKQRPYVGLHDLQKPKPGSEDWFGWLAHEMAHDFWHEHPIFRRSKDQWGEAMCDYSRYYLLLNEGMPKEAQRFQGDLVSADVHDRYKGGAYMLLQLDRLHHLDGPAGLWNYLGDKNFDYVFGKPHWKN
jgi:hypothetical protein